MKIVYFVISPPRTGTKSVCRMAHQCGFKIKHAPVNTVKNRLNDGHNFFADTPCFVPSFIESICENEDFEPRFIYIEKDFDKIFDSWKKVNLYLNYTRMYNQFMDESSREKMSVTSKTDFLSLHEIFSESFLDENNYEKLFKDHREKVLSIVKNKNKKVLIYKFEDGWEPFCKFLECDIPETEIPHININTMFEQII